MNTNILLCFSAGGHFTQMQQLIKHLPDNSFSVISENAPDVEEFVDENKINALLLPKVISNRFFFILQVVPNIFLIFKFAWSCKIMVSTGGITSVIPGVICFFLRKKIIFIK